MENKEINNKDIDVLDRVKELLNKKMFHKKIFIIKIKAQIIK